MTSSLLNLLEQIRPALRNVSGLPLPAFVLVSLSTVLFILKYLNKGGQVCWQLWVAAVRAALCGQKVARKPYLATVPPRVRGAEHMADKWDC